MFKIFKKIFGSKSKSVADSGVVRKVAKEEKKNKLKKHEYYKPVKEKKVINKKPDKKSEDKVKIYDILANPHFTEKAAIASERSVYAFKVKPYATKKSVAEAFEVIYKIKPEKVRILNSSKKPKRIRGTNDFTLVGGFKKAYVYLPRGQKINLS